jgi:hypothetical protein
VGSCAASDDLSSAKVDLRFVNQSVSGTNLVVAGALTRGVQL